MKQFLVVILLLVAVFLSPSQIFASKDLIQPSSKLYFLQTWKESITLFFTFSKEKKLDYLLQLTNKRVDEMKTDPTSAIVTNYEKHFQQLGELAAQSSNKEQVTEKIKDASIRQQEVLSKVYNQVPQQAKEAIINAQENSSKHVVKTIEAVEGTQKAQVYANQVALIQQAEKIGQVEQVPLEGSPNSDPSSASPKELKGINGPNQLKPVNPGSNNGGEGGGGQMQPAQPIQLNQPATQN